MTARRLPVLAALVLTLASAVPAPACTTFCLRDEGRIVFGKNYDWSVVDAGATDPVAYAFDTLDQVAQPGFTQWSIVYEVDRGRVHFRTRDQRKVRTLDLKAVDFACSTPVRVLDLAADVQGDVAKLLVPYTRDLNRGLVAASFRKTPFLARTPAAELERVARYPESDVCRR